MLVGGPVNSSSFMFKAITFKKKKNFQNFISVLKHRPQILMKSSRRIHSLNHFDYKTNLMPSINTRTSKQDLKGVLLINLLQAYLILSHSFYSSP